MIHVVGLGPGESRGRTGAASLALDAADIIVGYKLYVDLIRGDYPHKRIYENGMRGEAERCRRALMYSREGQRVAVVCSGDASVYGMASLILEMAQAYDAVEVVPGVTAALAASAVLGAPLAGDFAAVSLSDLLTPWEVIERRLAGAAMGDFCMALYNPASRDRADHLSRAAGIVLRYQREDTLCGIVRNIGRDEQSHSICVLSDLLTASVDMLTTVIVGNSNTIKRNDRLITPRGYTL